MIYLDEVLEGHLALAIESYARLLRDVDREAPTELLELARQVRIRLMLGQEGSLVDALEAAMDGVDMDDQQALLLTYPRAAKRLDVSTSTIKRLVASGQLRSVKVGGSSRIHVADLEDYAKRLRGGFEHKEIAG